MLQQLGAHQVIHHYFFFQHDVFFVAFFHIFLFLISLILFGTVHVLPKLHAFVTLSHNKRMCHMLMFLDQD
jgi:hypothetical protein